MSSFVPSAITQPFFELQTPDFAWKFVWTVPTNYEKKIVKKNLKFGRRYRSSIVVVYSISSVDNTVQTLEFVVRQFGQLSYLHLFV